MGIVVDKEKCTGCKICFEKCPFDAIKLTKENIPVFLENCTMCGICVKECPVDAIVIEKKTAKPDINKEDYSGVMIYGEVVKDKLSHVALEMLSIGRELAEKRKTELSSVIIGKTGLKKQAQHLIEHGADRVYIIEDNNLEYFIDEIYAEALKKVLIEKKPEIFIGGATAQGRALFPRVAAMIKTGLTADCTELDIDSESGNLVQTRPAFGGNIMARILTPDHRPQMATIRPRVMPVTEKQERKGKIEKIDFDSSEFKKLKTIKEAVVISEDDVNLPEAEIIVSAGRGVGSKENLKLIYELADKLNAAVGASRAVVDSDWISYPHQVGQTGTTVSPKVYIACGISGAIQHQVGMRSSDIIIAINKDPDAPIFDIATYGFVGDLHSIIPKLIKML